MTKSTHPVAIAIATGGLPPRAARALRHVLVFAGFLALHLCLYNGLWANDYYKDDYQWIADARDVARHPAALLHRHPDNTEIFARQTQRVLLGLTYRCTGMRPAGFYVVSLGLHTLAATLVFALFRVLLAARGQARGFFQRLVCPLCGAVFFAASANHDVAVLWISAQSTLLVTALLVGLLLAALRYEERLHEPRVLALLAGIFLVALFTKSTAASFPLVLGACLLPDAEPGSPRRRGVLVLLGLLAAMALGQVLFTRATLGHVDLADALTTTGADSFRLSWNVPLNLAGAFLGCFVSQPQYARILPAALPFWFVSLLLLLLLGASLRFVARRRQVLLGVAWILITALPTSLFDYVQYSEGQITVNRYCYLPLVGAGIVVASLLQELVERVRKPALAAVLLFALGAGYVGVQAGPLRERLRYFHGYNASRAAMIRWTLDAARSKAKPGAVLYAVNWKQDDYQIRAVNRLYFEDQGYRLAGQREYDRLSPSENGDGVERWAAQYEDETKRLKFIELPPARARN